MHGFDGTVIDIARYPYLHKQSLPDAPSPIPGLDCPFNSIIINLQRNLSETNLTVINTMILSPSLEKSFPVSWLMIPPASLSSKQV